METKILVELAEIKGWVKQIKQYNEFQNSKIMNTIKQIEGERNARSNQVVVCEKKRKEMIDEIRSEIRPLEKSIWIGLGAVSIAVVLINIAIQIFL